VPSRDATSRWQGDLLHGKGAVSLDSSNAGESDVSYPARATKPDGQTSPEKLLAAAHSSALAMNRSGVLTRQLVRLPAGRPFGKELS
jgi:osmotically inducible protein OsmC